MLYYGHPFVLYIKFTNQTYRSVYEFPEFAEYGKLISFAFVIVVATTDDLGIDIDTLSDSHNFFCQFLVDINFHTMTHVEHFVHFLPRRTRLFLD